MSRPASRLTPIGRFADASNGTFLVQDEDGVHWVYKPVVGEAPLVDFPPGTLGRREVAAYTISEELGLGLVPETLWADGPFGEGSIQRWIEGEPTGLIGLVPPEALTEQWHPILAAETDDGAPIVLAHRDDEHLRQMALFDALLNNADRKASHVIASGERLFGVDHGLCLHTEPKLRTVLWGWRGVPFTESEHRLLVRAASLSAPLAPGLAEDEWESLAGRAQSLVDKAVFPSPAGTWRDVPWPPL